MGFEQKEKLVRDAGLHLMKYWWVINKSIQGVPSYHSFCYINQNNQEPLLGHKKNSSVRKVKEISNF